MGNDKCLIFLSDPHGSNDPQDAPLPRRQRTCPKPSLDGAVGHVRRIQEDVASGVHSGGRKSTSGQEEELELKQEHLGGANVREGAKIEYGCDVNEFGQCKI